MVPGGRARHPRAAAAAVAVEAEEVPDPVMNRDEAFAVLVGSCPSFSAGDAGHDYASSFEEPDHPDPFVRSEALAHHLVDLVACRDVEEVGWVAGAVERVLAEGDEDAVELVVLGFLEPLR